MTKILAPRFSPHIANDPVERCSRFIQGLNFDIQSLMVNNPPVTHAAALNAARRSEQISNRKKAVISMSARRAVHTAPAPQALRPVQTAAFKGPSSSAAPPAFGARHQLSCSHCKKPGHTLKDCKTYNNLCFSCGKAGHRRRECPEMGIAAPGRQLFALERATTGEYIYGVQ